MQDTPPHSCGPPVFSSYPEAAAHFRGLDLSGLQAKVQAEVRAAPPASLLQRLGCFAAPQTTLPSELRDEQVGGTRRRKILGRRPASAVRHVLLQGFLMAALQPTDTYQQAGTHK